MGNKVFSLQVIVYIDFPSFFIHINTKFFKK